MEIDIKTKEKIFRIAIDLFSRNGFYGVSIRDITKEVGIKESSFYKHYHSKDDLLDRIFGYFNEEFAKIKSPIKDDGVLKTIDPVVFLKRAFQSFLQYADTPLMGKIYRIVVMEQFRDNRARDILLNLYEKPLLIMKHYFHVFLSPKEAWPYDPEVLATIYQFALHSLVAELSLLKRYQEDTSLTEQRIDELCTFMGEFLKHNSQEGRTVN